MIFKMLNAEVLNNAVRKFWETYNLANVTYNRCSLTKFKQDKAFNSAAIILYQLPK